MITKVTRIGKHLVEVVVDDKTYCLNLNWSLQKMKEKILEERYVDNYEQIEKFKKLVSFIGVEL